MAISVESNSSKINTSYGSVKTVENRILPEPEPQKTLQKDQFIKKSPVNNGIPATALNLPLKATINSTAVSSTGIKIGTAAEAEKKEGQSSEAGGIKTKDMLNVLSTAADGAGTMLEKFDFIEEGHLDAIENMDMIDIDIDMDFLDGVDAFGVQTLKLAATLLRLGAKKEGIEEEIEKKNAYGIAFESVGIARGLWGTAITGLKATAAGAALGGKIGLVSGETVVSMAAKEAKISGFVTKVAIPFAVASTALNGWDFGKEFLAVADKRTELKELKKTNLTDTTKHEYYKQREEVRLKRQAGALAANTALKGAALGFSVISTTALITSVTKPSTAKYTVPIALGAGIANSVVKVFASEKTRALIDINYEITKTKFNRAYVGAYKKLSGD